MPVDEILEGAARLVGRILFEIVVEVLYEILGYYVGFAILRALSLGYYPPRESTDSQATLCKVVGVFSLLGGIGLAFYFANNS